jgi:aryl-alcohol dehydrogenase-like predicted oxidoreductase
VVDRLKKIAAEAGFTPAQMVLAWALSKPAIKSVIAGARKPEQVALNAKAASIELPQDVLMRWIVGCNRKQGVPPWPVTTST